MHVDKSMSQKEREKRILRKSNGDVIPMTIDGVLVFENIDEVVAKIAKDITDGSDLQNKYLYIGTHGAKGWRYVSKYYEIGVNSRVLLKNNFSKIHNHITSIWGVNSTEDSFPPYDIISLGCGSGEDDVEMLTAMMELDSGVRAISYHHILVDLSFELLLEASRELKTQAGKYKQSNQQIQVLPVLCDITRLSAASHCIGFEGHHRTKEHALYHLLGLTLGNNNELVILRAIANAMHEGDYLLVEVDLSVGVDSALQASKNAYMQPDSRKYIDQFLCGPLLHTAEWKYVANTHIVNLSLSHESSGVRVDHRSTDDGKGWVDLMSKVTQGGTISLVRFLEIEEGPLASTVPRLSDYSNKYSKKGFGEFCGKLSEMLIPLELEMKSIDQYGLPGNSTANESNSVKPLQHLVLFRRMPKVESKGSQWDRAIKWISDVEADAKQSWDEEEITEHDYNQLVAYLKQPSMSLVDWIMGLSEDELKLPNVNAPVSDGTADFPAKKARGAYYKDLIKKLKKQNDGK